MPTSLPDAAARVPSPTSISVRESRAEDLPAIAAIYAVHVTEGTASYELVAPSLEEIATRREAVLAAGWPWLVAEADGHVIGYAYASLFRPRGAYRYCVEDSIYLAPHVQRLGAGRQLLTELMARCEAQGARQMVAVIGDAAHLASSIALHRALGFHDAGVLKASGWKFGRWLDTVLMQRALGDGDASDADAAAAPPARSAS